MKLVVKYNSLKYAENEKKSLNQTIYVKMYNNDFSLIILKDGKVYETNKIGFILLIRRILLYSLNGKSLKFDYKAE